MPRHVAPCREVEIEPRFNPDVITDTTEHLLTVLTEVTCKQYKDLLLTEMGIEGPEPVEIRLAPMKNPVVGIRNVIRKRLPQR